MDKSYVAMERKICIVCTQEYDTGNVLLDKRLKDSMDKHVVTGMGICPEHKKLSEEGYIALVEVDPKKSTNIQKGEKGKTVKQSEAYRTGNIAHILRSKAKEIFNIDEKILAGDMMFTEPDVLALLSGKTPEDPTIH